MGSESSDIDPAVALFSVDSGKARSMTPQRGTFVLLVLMAIRFSALSFIVNLEAIPTARRRGSQYRSGLARCE